MTYNFISEFEKTMQDNKLKNVVILAHMNPDGDAAGSVLGIAHYLYNVYPQYKVFPYLSEKLDSGPKKQVLKDGTFNPFIKPSLDRYAVIVCDTATRERIIGLELYERAVASIIIDHHAANEGYGVINHTTISESCAENIYYLLDWNKYDKSDSHPNAADYIYMGILHDTGGFTRSKETTMAACAGLINMGVDHNYVMDTMHNDTFETIQKRGLLLSLSKSMLDGKVAYVIIDEEAKQKYHIGYEDIHPISGYLRDCVDVELGFSMYEEESNIWRCSFRSDGKWINVNELLNPFGGGGHAGAAGLRKSTDSFEKLFSDIANRIKLLVQ